MLDDGAERHVAQALAGQRIACDERLQHGRHHVLVRAAGVGRVRTAKRNANAADHGDPTSLKIAHATLRSNVQWSSIKVRAMRVVRYGVVFLREAGTLQSPHEMPVPGRGSRRGARRGLRRPAIPKPRSARCSRRRKRRPRRATSGSSATSLGAGYRDARGNDRDASCCACCAATSSPTNESRS